MTPLCLSPFLCIYITTLWAQVDNKPVGTKVGNCADCRAVLCIPLTWRTIKAEAFSAWW
jgi:hypothetical protein